MIVYGDTVETTEAAGILDEIEERIARLAELPAGMIRHAALVSLLIRAGQLTQGLADRVVAEAGRDAHSPAADAAMALTMAIARTVVGSLDAGTAGRRVDSGAAGVGCRRPAAPALDAHASGPLLYRLRDCTTSGPLTLTQPEGYAFYAVYPETYALAARTLPAGDWRFVGIRSIGASLSAMAAAAVGAPTPITVRPVEHPFERRVEAAESLARAAGAPDGPIAVVDEGPGLSGSSFGAVTDWLIGHGVPEDRLALLPSHAGGPGPEASHRHRGLFGRLRTSVVGFDDWALAPRSPPALLSWVEDLTGAPEGPLVDISSGVWRGRTDWGAAGLPAVFRQQERRKFLMRTRTGLILLKFAGLGTAGEVKLRLASTLAAAGFSAPVMGLRHGFLVERWMEGATPLTLASVPDDELLARLAAYLGFRARRFIGGPAGADPGALLAMVLYNVETGMGAEAAARIPWRPEDMPGLARRVCPVAVDGRLHRHEWLVAPSGRLLKTDAVDHHAAHDLVGRQDIAWDVAGAVVEFGLGPESEEALRRRVEIEANVPVDPWLVAFCRMAYAAFQLGRSTFAAQDDGDPAEAARHRADIGRYASAVRESLDGGGRPA